MSDSKKSHPSTPRSGAAAAAVAPPQQHASGVRAVLMDYWTLSKPEISFVVVLSSVAGFLLGTPGTVDLVSFSALVVGVSLTAAGVGALNQYFEREFDASMRRTSGRPVPAGRVSSFAAASYGTLMVISGVALLCPLTNPLTGVLAAATVLLYVFVYTPLKRRTTLNTIVGTVPGALPALGGWTAATGAFGLGGWILFGVLVAWQMPHFLSLAWMYRNDYRRAGMKMTPGEHGLRPTLVQTATFSILLLPLAAAPWLIGLAGPAYGVGSILLGLAFLYPVYLFWRRPASSTARRVLLASVAYIPVLLLLLIADRIV